MAENIPDGFIEVGPFHEDVERGYRHCEYCGESAVDDIHAGLSQAEWRKFYISDDDDQLCVCDRCVDIHRMESGA